MMAPARALLANYLLSESALLARDSDSPSSRPIRLWTRGRTARCALVWRCGRARSCSPTAGEWHRGRSRPVGPAAAATRPQASDPRRRVCSRCGGGRVSVLSRGLCTPCSATMGVSKMPSAISLAVTGAPLSQALSARSGTRRIAWPAVAVLGAMAMFRWRRRGGMPALVLLAIPIALIVSTDSTQSSCRSDAHGSMVLRPLHGPVVADLGRRGLVNLDQGQVAPHVSCRPWLHRSCQVLPCCWSPFHHMPRDMRWVDVHVLGITPWLTARRRTPMVENQSWDVIVLTGLALDVLDTRAGFHAGVGGSYPCSPVDLAFHRPGHPGHRPSVGSNGFRLPSTLGVTVAPARLPIGVDRNDGCDWATLWCSALIPLPSCKSIPLDPPPGASTWCYVSWLKANEAPPGVKIFEADSLGLADSWRGSNPANSSIELDEPRPSCRIPSSPVESDSQAPAVVTGASRRRGVPRTRICGCGVRSSDDLLA